MTNSFLSKKATSEGDRRVWTYSCWFKGHVNEYDITYWHWIWNTDVNGGLVINMGGSNWDGHLLWYDDAGNPSVKWDPFLRDTKSWYHIHLVHDTTRNQQEERVRAWINGNQCNESNDHSSTWPGSNDLSSWNEKRYHEIGRWSSGTARYLNASICDAYYIDGQAIEPHVFGYPKQGYGSPLWNNLSTHSGASGSYSVERKSGEWMPKSPRAIKAEVNKRGGFGVNGFYLPMNAGNPGADFHVEPDTILKIKSDLAQPKAEIDGDPKSAINDDPFGKYCVLAVPMVNNGLGANGFGDYSHLIRKDGTGPKAVTNNNVEMMTHSGNDIRWSVYYDSSAKFTDNDYLEFPSHSDFDLKDHDFTIEGWFNSSDSNNTMSICTRYNGTATDQGWWLGWTADNKVAFYWYHGSTNHNISAENNTLTTGQWDHICAERYGNRVTLYVNGAAVASKVSDVTINDSSLSVRFGRDHYTSANYSALGYMSDWRIYNGVAKYKGGFDVPKVYTAFNFGTGTWRIGSKDAPRNNYAHFDVLAMHGISSMNYASTRWASGGNNTGVWSDIPFPAYGKWYMEMKIDDGEFAVCLAEDRRNDTNWQPGGSGDNGITFYLYYNNGSNKMQYNGSAAATLPSSWIGTNVGNYSCSGTGAGDVYRVLIDRDAQTIKFINKCGQEGLFNLPSYFKLRHLHIGYSVTTTWGASDSTWNWGQTPFTHSIPEGYKTLCTKNLRDPVIKDPSEHFSPLLYSGNGEGDRAVSGFNFKPDLLIIKERSSTSSWKWFDSNRGAGMRLSTNESSDAQTIEVNGIVEYNPSFDERGFSLGSDGGVNQDGQSYVAYGWKANGGVTTTNTEGNITSEVQVNQDAGFSIATWTGGGQYASTDTVGHGLLKTPKFTIVKALDLLSSSHSNDWWFYFGEDDYSRGRLGPGINDLVYIDGSNALKHAPNDYRHCHTLINTNSSTPVFKVNNKRYVCYTWAQVEGYSAFGIYKGNGSSDGPSVYCGFKPAMVWVCRHTNGSGEYWTSRDAARNPQNDQQKHIIYQGLSNGDSGDGGTIDFQASGFKIRDTSDTRFNTSGEEYIYCAWAESPFKYANSK